MRQKDRTAFNDALDEARAIVDGAKEAERDLSPDEKAEVDALVAKAEAAKARVEEDARDDVLANRIGALLGGDLAKSDVPDVIEPRTLGEAFVDNPAFKSWVEGVSIDGRVPDSFKNFRSPSVPISSKFISTVDMATSFPNEQRMGVLVQEPWPLGYEGLLSLLSRGTTSAAVIYYAVEDWTNAADFVAEATATSGVTGSKPESDVTYTPASVTVGTVAHWVAATKNSLADYGQLRALIDNGLRRGVLAKIGSAVLAGDGVAPEWFGFNTLASIPAQAYATSPLVSIKNSLVALESVGFRANGIVMNPTDWAAIDQTTPQVITDPLANRAPVIGGVPVVTVPTQPVGFAIVGDFKQAYLLDREAATITATDSHADFFIRNMVAILGEWRGAFFVPQPTAFRKVDLTV